MNYFELTKSTQSKPSINMEPAIMSNGSDWRNYYNQPTYLSHQSYLSSVYINDCGYVLQLPEEERCAFINETRDCRDAVASVDHLYRLFCHQMGHLSNWKLLLFLYWCTFLAKLLVSNAKQNVVPMFLVCAKNLRMTSHMAGISILVLANGMSDIFPSFWKYRGETEMLINQHMGSAMFATAFIGGIIIIRQPFVWRPQLLVNDLFWYFVSILWLSLILRDEKVRRWEAGICVVMFAIYFGSSVLAQIFGDSDMNIRHPDEINEEILDCVEMSEVHIEANPSGGPQNAIAPAKTEKKPVTSIDEEVDRGIWSDFFHYLKIRTIPPQDWQQANCFGKVYLLFVIPSNIFIMLLIPSVNYKLPKIGWCKLMFICNVVLMPQFMFRILSPNPEADTLLHQLFQDNRSHVWYILAASLIAAMVIACQCDVNKPFRLYERCAFAGIVGSAIIIFFAASELSAAMAAVSSILSISKQTIGLSVLTWANCLGEYVALMELTRTGYHESAHAATIAGPIFYSVLGIGTTFWKRNDNKMTTGGSEARQGTMGLTSQIFLIMLIVQKLVFAVALNFHARRIVGIFLISYYCFYVVFFVLNEVHVLHAYGTDHFDETP